MDGYATLSDKAAELSADQMEAIVLMADLRTNDFFRLPTDPHKDTPKVKDIAKVCPRGGEIAADDSEASFSQKRTDANSNTVKASGRVTVNAKNCLLLKKRKWVDGENGAEGHFEPVGPQHEYGVSGSVVVDSTASGRISRAGGQDKKKAPEDTADFEFIVSHGVSGSIDSQITNSAGDKSTHKIEFKDYGIAYLSSDEIRKELQIIEADPLGDEQRKAAKVDFFSAKIKCKGSVIIDGASIDCAPFTKRMILRRINGK